MDLATNQVRSTTRKARNERVNLLDPVVKSSPGKGRKLFVDHTVHLLYENGVLSLEELITRVRPLFDRLFYKSPGYNERIIIRKFTRLGPALVSATGGQKQ